MKTLPLIIAAGHFCMALGLASAAQAAIPQTKTAPPQAPIALSTQQMAWAKQLAHPIVRHTLCQPEGRQAFSAKTCATLSQLAPQPTAEGQVIDIKSLKANRSLWYTLPMNVRERLETYDVLVIATPPAQAPAHLAR